MIYSFSEQVAAVNGNSSEKFPRYYMINVGTCLFAHHHINKNVMACFLLMMCKDTTLTRSTNLIGRHHPHHVFD